VAVGVAVLVGVAVGEAVGEDEGTGVGLGGTGVGLNGTGVALGRVGEGVVVLVPDPTPATMMPSCVPSMTAAPNVRITRAVANSAPRSGLRPPETCGTGQRAGT